MLFLPPALSCWVPCSVLSWQHHCPLGGHEWALGSPSTSAPRWEGPWVSEEAFLTPSISFLELSLRYSFTLWITPIHFGMFPSFPCVSNIKAKSPHNPRSPSPLTYTVFTVCPLLLGFCLLSSLDELLPPSSANLCQNRFLPTYLGCITPRVTLLSVGSP